MCLRPSNHPIARAARSSPLLTWVHALPISHPNSLPVRLSQPWVLRNGVAGLRRMWSFLRLGRGTRVLCSGIERGVNEDNLRVRRNVGPRPLPILGVVP